MLCADKGCFIADEIQTVLLFLGQVCHLVIKKGCAIL